MGRCLLRFTTRVALKRCFKLYVVLVLFLLSVVSGPVAAEPAEPVRINVAEGILDPFWDPDISSYDQWTVDDGAAHGLKVFQNWAAVDFAWERVPASGPVLRMGREHGVSVAEYDTLLVQLAVPKGTRVRLHAKTDAGARDTEAVAAEDGPFEYELALEGAKVLQEVAIQLFATAADPGAGWCEWVGVQNKALLPLYERRWDYSGLGWDRLIQPEGAPLTFTPVHGIFLNGEELDALRKENEEAMAESGASRFTRQAEAATTMDFEGAIREFVESGGRDGGRTRDKAGPPMPGGTRLAEAGLVLRDRELLVAAARYALSLAASGRWDRNFRAHFPGGPADDRAFRRSYTCEDIAEILDLAGEIFTQGGRRYLLRRLAEEGVGPIDYVAWRHDYIHETNQLAYFNKGRVFALLVLERTYPRARPYTDLAMQDSIDNLNRAILPDGGYAEGATYFGALVRRNYQILKTFARARAVDVGTLVPDSLRSTSDYIEAFSSTTGDDVIPVGDSGRDLDYETMESMVDLMPGSYWQAVLDKHLARDGRPASGGEAPGPRPFVALPDMGTVASFRLLDRVPVKVLIPGNPPGADHAHEDKGSFVLEFGGEAFAMDLGSTDYEDPIHQLYKQAQRHNMLVPSGTEERPAPPIKLLQPVRVEGAGDAGAFRAQVDATPGWEPYYASWVRTWASPAPDQLRITDTYELKRGTGVAFYWQTRLPCRVEGKTVDITGARGTVTLTAPEDCAVSLETLPLAGGATQTRIAITREGMSGTLTVDVRLLGNSEK